MVYAAMLLAFFSCRCQASNSLITNTQLITKVYFPRIIIPISSVVTVLGFSHFLYHPDFSHDVL
jgi:lipopolysaccharide transport system permease protein